MLLLFGCLVGWGWVSFFVFDWLVVLLLLLLLLFCCCSCLWFLLLLLLLLLLFCLFGVFLLFEMR